MRSNKNPEEIPISEDKVSVIVDEYDRLMHIQAETQRQYYESMIEDIKAETELKISCLQEQIEDMHGRYSGEEHKCEQTIKHTEELQAQFTRMDRYSSYPRKSC